ncbi:uncharacterized protein TrAtP1_011369 [Trichoderma atroviride]|uniref:uncharacterized protein n=1 Tax=Hypocrea atroviridis TaxID=63577 RepID=UPI003333CAB4|nr:hypothetical protein TrAtP1_011369 [Trichoderma atroviride]
MIQTFTLLMAAVLPVSGLGCHAIGYTVSSAASALLPLDVVPTAARFGSSTQTLYINGKNEDEKTPRSNFETQIPSRWSDSKRASPATVSKHGVNARDPWGEGLLCVAFSLLRSNQQQLLVAACNASFFERLENGLDLQIWPERPTAAEYDEPKGFSLARTCLARQKGEGILASKCMFRRHSRPCFLLVIFT